MCTEDGVSTEETVSTEEALRTKAVSPLQRQANENGRRTAPPIQAFETYQERQA